MSDDAKYWYRYEMQFEEGDEEGRLFLWRFPVLRTSGKALILSVWGRERRVYPGSRKCIAKATLEEAQHSFRMRKRHAASYAARRHDQATACLRQTEEPSSWASAIVAN